MFEKREPYRNKRILDAAKGEQCTLQIGPCTSTETTVFAHLNESWAGKGIGQKADDLAGFFACSACHDKYDRNEIAQVDRWVILRAYYRTIRKLIDRGVIT